MKTKQKKYAGNITIMRAVPWEKSCDFCLHQEGKHYCLFHAQQFKNMDTIRCGAWMSKYGDR